MRMAKIAKIIARTTNQYMITRNQLIIQNEDLTSLEFKAIIDGIQCMKITKIKGGISLYLNKGANKINDKGISYLVDKNWTILKNCV